MQREKQNGSEKKGGWSNIDIWVHSCFSLSGNLNYHLILETLQPNKDKVDNRILI